MAVMRRLDQEAVLHTQHVGDQHRLGDPVLLLDLLQHDYDEDDNNEDDTFSLRCIMMDFRLRSIPGRDIRNSQGSHRRNNNRTYISKIFLLGGRDKLFSTHSGIS